MDNANVVSVDLVTVEHIHAAAERIKDAVIRTPLFPCGWSDSDRPLWLKPENLAADRRVRDSRATDAIARIP